MPFKIMMLVSSMNSGGAERVASELVNAWAERGDSVTLLLTYSQGGECFYRVSPKARMLWLRDLAGGRLALPKGYLGRFNALRRAIREARPDVVVSFLTNVNVAAVLSSIGLNIKVVVSERIYPPAYPMSWGWRVLRRLVYPLADRVVMLSDEGLEWLRREIPSAHGIVVPNSTECPLPDAPPRLAPAAFVRPERKLLLAVGRLDHQKGLTWLLDAFARLAGEHASWDLLILGEGPDRPDLERHVSALGLGGRVSFPGRAGNLSDWYRRADLYVMTSRFEGFPNTLLEAMAHGCASVSYDCDTGPRDLIANSVNGVLVSPVGDVPALAGSLDWLMRDDEARARLGANGRRVLERYSRNSILRMWDGVFAAVGEAPR